MIQRSVILFASILLIAGKFCGAENEWKDAETERMKDCAQQVGANFGEIEEYYKSLMTGNVKPQPENYGCFALCMFKKHNMISDTGKITIPEQLPKKEKIQACLDEIEPNQNDLCETARQGKECFFKAYAKN